MTDDGFKLIRADDFLRNTPLTTTEYDLEVCEAEVDRLRAEVARLRELLARTTDLLDDVTDMQIVIDALNMVELGVLADLLSESWKELEAKP